MFMSKKRKRRERNLMIAAGAGVACGVVGITMSAVTFAATTNKNKKMQQEIDELRMHVSKCESMITDINTNIATLDSNVMKINDAMIPMQKTLLSHNMLK